jgi:hypothetical protein
MLVAGFRYLCDLFALRLESRKECWVHGVCSAVVLMPVSAFAGTRALKAALFSNLLVL